jgi:hypothetical protein
MEGGGEERAEGLSAEVRPEGREVTYHRIRRTICTVCIGYA